MIDVRLLRDEGDTVVIGWDPVPGAAGYRFVTSASSKMPHTWDPMFTRFPEFRACNTRIDKADWYKVEALGVTDQGVYPLPVEPPPPPPPPAGDPTAYGYRPELPAGYTLVEGKSLSQSDYNGKQKIMFRNCTGGVWFTNAATADLIFVDCDMRGGCGAFGKRISFYGCRFGQRVNGDACQVRPNTSGGERPQDWLFQGCTLRDITRTDDSHTDGIQFGGVLGATVRHCYFDNIAVEMILCNGWNGKPEDVLVERSYFGSRTDPGGPPIHFSHPGSSGQSHPWASTNCRAVDNYYDGTVASIEPGTVGCSQSGTRPRSEWPHRLRPDGWLDY